jgi:hypothetical protein
MSFDFHPLIVALCAACVTVLGAEFAKPVALSANSFLVGYTERAACTAADWASCEPMLGP